MSHIATNEIRRELKKIIGENCEPTQELEKMLLDAYAKGRSDTLEALGLEECDLSPDKGLMAWTA